MKELRNEFLINDFVVNRNIVKSISNIDITLDEFLMVLYFINVSCVLDIDSIKERLGFDEEKAVDMLNTGMIGLCVGMAAVVIFLLINFVIK